MGADDAFIFYNACGQVLKAALHHGYDALLFPHSICIG